MPNKIVATKPVEGGENCLPWWLFKGGVCPGPPGGVVPDGDGTMVAVSITGDVLLPVLFPNIPVGRKPVPVGKGGKTPGLGVVVNTGVVGGKTPGL